MAWNEEGRIRCRFEFTCPQFWSRLQPTDKDDVRHCAECDREVHLALSEEAFRRHSKEGRCVAVRVVREDGGDDSTEPVYWVGEPAAPYNPSLRRV